ncbi:MAG: hypothetical protein KF767_05260 [Bdellovibrionaceae bacterium]|nr:hypothetical protein [Pseudobdellovibrionaceae bacterium]
MKSLKARPTASPSGLCPSKLTTKRRSKGQAILEYILLLTVSMGIAAIIIKSLVSRNPDSPGALLYRWDHINKEIGRDDPNKSK